MTEFVACFLQEWWPFPCSETTLQVFAVCFVVVVFIIRIVTWKCLCSFDFVFHLFICFNLRFSDPWSTQMVSRKMLSVRSSKYCQLVSWLSSSFSYETSSQKAGTICSWQCWASPKTAAFKTDQAGGRASLRWSWLFNVQANQCHSPLPLFSQHPQEEQDPHRLVLDSLSRGPSCISCQSSC